MNYKTTGISIPTIIFTVIWVFVLNMLCQNGMSGFAWIGVIVPTIVTFAVIAAGKK